MISAQLSPSPRFDGLASTAPLFVSLKDDDREGGDGDGDGEDQFQEEDHVLSLEEVRDGSVVHSSQERTPALSESLSQDERYANREGTPENQFISQANDDLVVGSQDSKTHSSTIGIETLIAAKPIFMDPIDARHLANSHSPAEQLFKDNISSSSEEEVPVNIISSEDEEQDGRSFFSRSRKKSASLKNRGYTSDLEITAQHTVSSRSTRNSGVKYEGKRLVTRKPGYSRKPYMENNSLPNSPLATQPSSPMATGSLPNNSMIPHSPSHPSSIPFRLHKSYSKKRSRQAHKSSTPKSHSPPLKASLQRKEDSLSELDQDSEQNTRESESDDSDRMILQQENTSNSSKHLSISPSHAHPRKRRKPSALSSTSISHELAKSAFRHSPAPVQQHFTLHYSEKERFLNHIIYDLQPANAVERFPFAANIWTSSKSVQRALSTRNVENTIYELYEEHFQALLYSLHETPSKISLSLRVFKCPTDGGSILFMEVFGHWIDACMNYHVRLLDFWCIPESPSSDLVYVIASAVYRTITNFELRFKIFAITIDKDIDGLGSKSVVGQLKHFYPAEMPAPEIYTVYSLSSTLDEIANLFLGALNAAAWPFRVWYDFSVQVEYTHLNRGSTVFDHPVTALRIISHYFRANQDHIDLWADLCYDLGFASEYSQPVVLDEPGNWLSTYDMLRDATEKRKVINKATELIPALKGCRIKEREWIRIKHIRQFLHILRKLEMDCDDSKPQFNLYAMLLWKIQEICKDVNTRAAPYASYEPAVCEAFTKACRNFPWIFDTEQWPHPLPLLGSLLDPRQMANLIADTLGQASAAQWKHTMLTFAKLYRPPEVEPEAIIDVEDDENGEVYDSQNSEFSSERVTPAKKESKSPAAKEDEQKDFLRPRNASPAEDIVDLDDEEDALLSEKLVLGKPRELRKADLNDYFLEALVPYSSMNSGDVMLRWWDTHISFYPEFGGAARDIFGVATGSESSAAKLLGPNFDQLVSNRWNQVSFEWLKRLVFLRATMNGGDEK